MIEHSNFIWEFFIGEGGSVPQGSMYICMYVCILLGGGGGGWGGNQFAKEQEKRTTLLKKELK